MPELPEVLTIKKDLTKEIQGKKVKSVSTKDGYTFEPSKDHFKNHVAGHSVEEVGNVAKLLYIKFSSGYVIASHLNMTGRLLWNMDDGYTKMVLEFDDGNELHYSTVRMFGYFKVWSSEELEEYSKKYGKPALDKSLTVEEFAKKLKGKNTNIKNALLDQKLISGIGNIYANDALFMSSIHPKRKTKDLKDYEYKELFKNVKEILKEGLKNRGSSIDRYADLYGKPGSQQKHFRIYGKKNGTCVNCGNDVTFEKFQGRGTYYCTTCQPETLQTNQNTLL